MTFLGLPRSDRKRVLPREEFSDMVVPLYAFRFALSCSFIFAAGAFSIIAYFSRKSGFRENITISLFRQGGGICGSTEETNI
uniref:Uncharacterized protein n=1 Tax=Siphoviridae sp. ctHn727 TaxID=2825425 RepID=A0A8S5V7W2_9CAUD|nr:MAG TPA: hypothetical protein [Siphoviridae sp. ctHn727]